MCILEKITWLELLIEAFERAGHDVSHLHRYHEELTEQLWSNVGSK